MKIHYFRQYSKFKNSNLIFRFKKDIKTSSAKQREQDTLFQNLLKTSKI